jgi:hypothetical protein
MHAFECSAPAKRPKLSKSGRAAPAAAAAAAGFVDGEWYAPILQNILVHVLQHSRSGLAWCRYFASDRYVAADDETPAQIAAKLCVGCDALLLANGAIKGPPTGLGRFGRIIGMLGCGIDALSGLRHDRVPQ